MYGGTFLMKMIEILRHVYLTGQVTVGALPCSEKLGIAKQYPLEYGIPSLPGVAGCLDVLG
jgi:hypothetical protein